MLGAEHGAMDNACAVEIRLADSATQSREPDCAGRAGQIKGDELPLNPCYFYYPFIYPRICFSVKILMYHLSPVGCVPWRGCLLSVRFGVGRQVNSRCNPYKIPVT